MYLLLTDSFAEHPIKVPSLAVCPLYSVFQSLYQIKDNGG